MKAKILLGTSILVLSVVIASCGPSDVTIQKEVTQSLEMVVGKVTGTVSKGVVTLTGTVETDAQKSDAELAIKSVKGVKQVKNEITVVPPAPKISPDQALGDLIKKALSGTEFKDIQVTVANGVATLVADLKKKDAKKVTELVTKAGAKSVVINKPEKPKK